MTRTAAKVGAPAVPASAMGAGVPLRYHLLAYRRDHLWLPAGIWGLFAVLVTLAPVARPDQIGAAFLGVVLPLLAGVLAATCVLEDPALELQFAAPRRPRRILLERLGMLLGIVTVGSVTFQGFLGVVGIDVSAYGGLLQRQMLWLVPCLAMMALGSVVALGTAQSTTGAMMAGLIWLAQVLFYSRFIESPWARYGFFFLGFYRPGSSYLIANNLCLIGLTALLTLLAWRALERQERYL